MRKKPIKKKKAHGWLAFFIIAIATWFTGCNLLGPSQMPKRITPPPEVGRMEDARELVRSYMEARLAEADPDELSRYLTEGAKSDYQGRSGLSLTGSSEAPFFGYRIYNSSKVEPGEFGFSVAIQSSYMARPMAENIREDLLVQISNNIYQVTSARFLGSSQVRAQAGDLLWKNEAVQSTLMRLSDLPNEFSPIGSKGERFGVGKDAFLTLAIRPDDGEVAFATAGTHGLIGTVAIKNPPTITPIDLFFEGNAKLLVYSPDGRYLAVEEAAPSGSSRVRAYNPKMKRLLDLNLDTAFPQDQYYLNISRWETESKTLLIRVNRFTSQANEERLGTWAVNVETGEREKIIM
ncbi:MAG TPA: hypothetical protein VHR47_04810 [Bacillota bacterium]|nr:hypothetical protein [Bacillota bacterium]